MIASPAYWAVDGLKAPLGPALGTATYPGAPGSFQPPILGPGGPLALDLLALLAQAAAAARRRAPGAAVPAPAVTAGGAADS